MSLLAGEALEHFLRGGSLLQVAIVLLGGGGQVAAQNWWINFASNSSNILKGIRFKKIATQNVSKEE